MTLAANEALCDERYACDEDDGVPRMMMDGPRERVREAARRLAGERPLRDGVQLLLHVQTPPPLAGASALPPADELSRLLPADHRHQRAPAEGEDGTGLLEAIRRLEARPPAARDALCMQRLRVKRAHLMLALAKDHERTRRTMEKHEAAGGTHERRCVGWGGGGEHLLVSSRPLFTPARRARRARRGWWRRRRAAAGDSNAPSA
jgi:hypothetical protein